MLFQSFNSDARQTSYRRQRIMARTQRFLAPPQMLRPGDACHRCPLMGQVQEPFSNVAIYLVAPFGCCERWRCVRECRKGRSKGFCSDPPNCCQHGQQGMCLGTSYPKAVANSFVAIYSPRSLTSWSTLLRKCTSSQTTDQYLLSPFILLQHTNSRTTWSLSDKPTGLWGQHHMLWGQATVRCLEVTMLSYHIISYHIIFYHIISYHIISYHNMI